MSKHKSLLTLFTLCLSFCLSAQTGPQQLLSVVPPSPTVASLGKYGDIPVSLYTGIPSINIPLYEIKDGSLSLPVSLSYHAGGIKVEEVASSVGLGWSLNAGGIVGRSVRGLPDEIAPWQPQPVSNRIDNIMSTGTTAINQLASDVERGYRDGEADLYYFNFGPYSGKFFYDQSGVIHVLPNKKFLISTFQDGWKITAEDGTVYSFTKAERVGSSSCSGDQDIYSAWFLTSIKSSDGKREITFTYNAVNYNYQTLIGQTKYYSVNGTGGLCVQNQPPCVGTQNYNTHRLARIDFSEGYLKFNYYNDRCDLIMDKSLDEIEVYTKNNQKLKKYKLAYSYFGNNSEPCNTLTQKNKRLKLTSITEENATLQNPPYVFTYNESIPLPDRLSYAQDHWGYYNGKVSNPDLISSFTTVGYSGQPIFFPGADRRANPETAQAGILTKIKFPTGGESIFTYENNTVSDNRAEYQTKEENMILIAQNYPTPSLPNPYESSELVIPAGGAYVRFKVRGLTTSASSSFCDGFSCYIMKDNTTYTGIGDNWNDAVVFWAAGRYKIRVTNNCYAGAIADFSVVVSADIPTKETLTIRPVGGLRIKQTEDKPVNGLPVIKKYRYHPDNDLTRSSGILVNFPEYGYDLNVESTTTNGQGEATSGSNYCSYRVRQSFSNYPLATTQGSYVGYSHVIVDLGPNGESRHTFTAYGDVVAPTFPFAPVENFDWRRGFLLSAKDYVLKNNQLVLAKEISHTPTSFNETQVYGIKTGRDYWVLKNGSLDLQTTPKYSFYPTKTAFFALGQSKEKIYDQNDPTKFTETITDYTYSPKHLQTVQFKTTTSRSDQTVKEEIITTKKYPLDYTFTSTPSGSEALGIKKLQDLHVINAVIEEYAVKQNKNVSTNQVSDQRVTAGSIATFKSSEPYVDQLMNLELTTPIALSTFGDGSGLSANAFIKNTNSTIANSYKPSVLFDSYDLKGNLEQQHKNADINQAYLWGYNKAYPIAQAGNAKSGEILFDSFEEEGTWNGVIYDRSRAHAGRASARIINNKPSGELTCLNKSWLQVSLSEATTFKFSGWVYSEGPSTEIYLLMKRSGETGYTTYSSAVLTTTTGKWVFLEKEFSVPSDVVQVNVRLDNNSPGTVWFDDIRLHPSNAHMTTYTYDPLVGVTSEADRNNRFHFYHYDSFGRLMLLRDEDKNILKRFCYNYQGQTENCAIFGNEVKSGTFSKVCSGSNTTTEVTYTVPANTYYASTLAAANALAQSDVDANGQAYANGVEVCKANFEGYNSLTVNYEIKFTNTSTGQIFLFDLNAGTSTTSLFKLPVGTYNVFFTPLSAPGGNTTHIINNGVYNYTQYNTYTTFQNIAITGPSLVEVK